MIWILVFSCFGISISLYYCLASWSSMFHRKIYLLNFSENHFCYSYAKKKAYVCAVYVYPSIAVFQSFYCLAWWSWDIFPSQNPIFQGKLVQKPACTIDRSCPALTEVRAACTCSALPFSPAQHGCLWALDWDGE